jgi:hypothetical protein
MNDMEGIVSALVLSVGDKKNRDKDMDFLLLPWVAIDIKRR